MLNRQTCEKIGQEMGLYVKVTLFEDMKVIKAKKTRPIKAFNAEGNFNEHFSILFPESMMEKVTLKYCFLKAF